MGRRGPPPMTTAERKARGTYDSSRDRGANVVQTPPAEPEMPAGMPVAAQELWHKLVPMLVQAGTLAARDVCALTRFCREYVRWDKLQADAADNPRIETDYGPKSNPSGAEARKLDREVLQPLELALGLHYAARSRLRKPESGSGADPVADELFGPLTALQGGKD
jgi:P27 family predicted phage terminase small subunit